MEHPTSPRLWDNATTAATGDSKAVAAPHKRGGLTFMPNASIDRPLQEQIALALDCRELRKNSGLVHSNGLSLLARKTYNVLLANAFDDLKATQKQRHQIRVSELTEMLCFNSNNIGALREVCSGLMTTLVKFDLLRPDVDPKKPRGNWSQSTLIASVKVEDGVCTYEFSSEMAKRLATLEHDVRLNLLIQDRFQSAYALNLYENINPYRRAGGTQPISIDTLRVLLDCTEPYYDDFSRVSQKALKPAMEQINQVSDLVVSADFIRGGKGGKVTAVRFLVTEKLASIEPTNEAERAATQTDGYQKLISLGVTRRSAMAAALLSADWANYIADSVLDRQADGRIKLPGPFADAMIRRRTGLGYFVDVMPGTVTVPLEDHRIRRLRELFDDQRAATAIESMSIEEGRNHLENAFKRRKHLIKFNLADFKGHPRMLNAGATLEFRNWVKVNLLPNPQPGEFEEWCALKEAN